MRVRGLTPNPTQGCGLSSLPLGYLGIHRFAVLRSVGPREGRRVAAGRLVRGLDDGIAARLVRGCMRVRGLTPNRTQGCGLSALPLGYLGIHRFAVLRSAGPREGRRVAAGRLVRGLGAMRGV